MAIVEEDLARIGRWVTFQSESLHTKLSMLLLNCSDVNYPVDYLRGAAGLRWRGGGVGWGCARAARWARALTGCVVRVFCAARRASG